MKNLLFIKILFFLFMLNSNLSAQMLTEEKKEDYLYRLSIVTKDSMYTNNYFSAAVDELHWWVINEGGQEFNEAIPLLVEHLWDVPTAIERITVISLLNAFNAAETERLALEFIDSVDVSTDLGGDYTKNEFKIKAAHILFQLGNYTTYNYAFLEMGSDKPEISAQLISILVKIIEHVPTEKERAKNYLMDIAKNNSIDAVFRYYALSYLIEIYDYEMLPFFIERFKYEKEFSNCSLLLKFLYQFNSSEIESAFRYKLSTEEWSYLTKPGKAIWDNAIYRLLYEYGGVYNYKLVLEKSKVEPVQWEDTAIFIDLTNYKPIIPDSSATIGTILDTLISYTNQCYEYEWITNKGIHNSLSKNLENAKKDLAKGNEKPAKNKIEAFQNEVVAQNENHITEEGYKFLYYYSGYLIERL